MVEDHYEKKNIVILGAGFAGLRVVQDLCKKKLPANYQIILIDKLGTHLYTPDLYEIAAAFNEEITQECLLALTDSVATPIESLIDAQKVKFIREKVLKIDERNRKIELKSGETVNFDYLAVCLGSVPNFFGIEGLKEYSFPVKTIKNALALNCHLDMLFHKIWEEKMKSEVNIVVGGGGATGVEVAGELANCTHKLTQKYQLKDLKINISLVEAGHILAAMNEKGTLMVQSALNKQGVKVLMGTRITKVDQKLVHIKNEAGQSSEINYDVLVWSGGVMVNPVAAESLGDQECRGAIKVDDSLRSLKYHRVFASGDNAFYFDNNKNQRLPMLAQIASSQGKVVAENIYRSIKERPFAKYEAKDASYIIPVGAKFTFLSIGNHILSSRFFWFLKRIVAFLYFSSVMSSFKALKKALRGGKIFLRND